MMLRFGGALLAAVGLTACGQPFFKAGPAPAEPAFPVPAEATLVWEIGVSRSPCLGTCPVYAFTLGQGGPSTYVGQYYTPILGSYAGVVDSAAFAALARKLLDTHFFEWPRLIGVTALDASYVAIQVRTDQGTYSVSMESGSTGPGTAEFRALAGVIEDVAGQVAWTRVVGTSARLPHNTHMVAVGRGP